MEHDLEQLDEGSLREVTDWNKRAALYAEFAEEDRALAEADMADYAAGFAREDAAPRI